MTRDEAQERIRTERLAQLGALLAGFAHEVRNPLSTIGLNLQLVMEEFAQPETPRDKRAAKRLGVVEGEVKRLQGILEDFLRFARMPEMVRRPVAVNAVLQEQVEFMAPEMRSRGIALRLFADPEVREAELDVAQFKAALLNLLRNALDACQGGGEVLVSSRREGTNLVVRVMDTGAGMAPEVLAKAFTPYFSTKRHGHGLGLPMVKRIVEEHGGAVAVTSEPGRGTQFTLTLPLRAPAAGGVA